MSKQPEAFEAWFSSSGLGAPHSGNYWAAWEAWQASRAAALEEAAVAAWYTGMDEHNRLGGRLQDVRNAGSLAAQRIRALKEQS